MLALLGATPDTRDAGGSGPSGSPTSVSSYFYAGDKVGIQWVNGDGTAATRIYYKDDAGGCPSGYPGDLTLLKTVAPGVTSYGTGQTDLCNYFVVHYKDGIFSSWKQCIAGESSGCSSCPL